jgi:hypothetical protein
MRISPRVCFALSGCRPEHDSRSPFQFFPVRTGPHYSLCKTCSRYPAKFTFSVGQYRRTSTFGLSRNEQFLFTNIARSHKLRFPIHLTNTGPLACEYFDKLTLTNFKDIVTDLINAMPGNRSVNTVQHATIVKAVFSVDPTDAPIDLLDSDHVYVFTVRPCPFRGYINKSDRIRSGQLRVTSEYGRSTRTSKQGDSHGTFVVEELEIGLWRLNMWLEDFIYV